MVIGAESVFTWCTDSDINHMENEIDWEATDITS